MRVVITVLGKDRVGIIARVSAVLADNGVNILDISQTILQGLFNMTMIAEIAEGGIDVAGLAELLGAAGAELGVQVSVQHEDIFTAMHRV